MKSITALALVAFALALAGCADGDLDASSPVSVAQGRLVFNGACSSCHGADARGISGLGKILAPSPFVQRLTDDELLDFIKKGRDIGDPANTTGVAMPPKGANPALTNSQLRSVIAYLRSLQ
ncbi:MAG: cytochrome c [Dehalococcoidia bacterium]|nr:cytochrome c [Dehalococcoidia bacterium]